MEVVAPPESPTLPPRHEMNGEAEEEPSVPLRVSVVNSGCGARNDRELRVFDLAHGLAQRGILPGNGSGAAMQDPSLRSG